MGPSMSPSSSCPDYVKKYRTKLDTIVRDIANYDEADRFFPLARHKASIPVLDTPQSDTRFR